MNWNLRNKFLIPTILITIAAFAVTIYVTYSQTQKNMRHQIEEELHQVATLSAMHLQSWVEGVQQDITNWATLAEVKSVVDSPENYQASLALLGTFREKYGYYETILIANKKGEIIGSAREEDIGKINVADRGYFKQSLTESSVISEVIQSRLTGNPVFVVTQQIQTDSGMGMIIGVVDLNYFSQSYINPIKIGEEGYAYVIDETGLVIAHPNPDLIMEANLVENYDFGKSLLQGEEGIINYDWEGTEKQVAYQRITHTGWVLAAGATLDELLAPVRKMASMTIMLGVIVVSIIGILIFFIARSVANPIQGIIGELQQGAGEVSSAAGQVAESSQELAEGSSEQAASMEETSSSLEELTSMTSQNSDSAKQANSLAEETSNSARDGSELMEKMSGAIRQVEASSEETGKIIKTIDEIAFQTNLLALNAAVEAARAGEAGQGFAVVAEEVRTLAQRTAEAAKNTTELIEKSRESSKNSVSLVDQVSEAFTDIKTKALQVNNIIAEISAASDEQTQGIKQINTAVSQVDQVTQSIASSSEESAAASEELNAQSDALLGAVSRLYTIIEGAKSQHQITQGNSGTKKREKNSGSRGSSNQNDHQNYNAFEEKSEEFEPHRLMEKLH